MSNLSGFAAFIKNKKLEEFIQSELVKLQSLNAPLLNFFKHLGEHELLNRMRESATVFLSSLEEGNYLELTNKRLDDWENDRLPDISKRSIVISDIAIIYAAQKLSMIDILPSFTGDVKIAAGIMTELEMYYKEVQQRALETLQKIQNEDQQKLIESEEKYKDLFDNASDLIHISNPDGIILYVNDAWLKSLGYTREKLVGMPVYDLVHIDDRERFRLYRKELLQGANHHAEISICFMAKNGKKVNVEGTITCKFKNAAPEYTRGILRDVTKRKADEQQLKFYNDQLIEREENLKQLIRNAPDGVIVINEHSTILLWNEKAEQIFGWKEDAVIGKNMSEIIIPPQYRKAHIEGMARLSTTGAHRVLFSTIQITALKKSGDEFYIALTISPTRQGGKPAYIAFIRDIDEQKKIEIELENKRLQLEKTNEQLEQYAWLASHDLKEPLRKIMIFGDILVTKYSKDLPAEVQKHLGKINESARRMSELIEAILVYSNVTDESGLFKQTDLNNVVYDLLADLEMAIEKKNATIKIGKLPVIDAIDVQMRQLFQNLISNALNYTKPGILPVINISAEVENDKCFIHIKDNGIGFDNKYADKIFQLFQRLSSYEDQAGTGIGLALCKKIVSTHHGTITARSEEGSGAVFEIMLPVKHFL